MKRLLLAVAAVLALALAAGISVARVTRPAEGMLEMLNRAQPQRVHAARFSVGAEYHACTPVAAPGDSLVPRETCAEPNDSQMAELDVLAAAGRSLDPDSLRASALVSIVWDSTAVDDAIAQLSNAHRLVGNSGPLLVDLSAAHLVRAEQMQNPEDVWQALEYALMAVELEPGNLLARFNAALAAQAGYLREVAEQLWGNYLALDSTSQWADEGRHRRDRLRADSVFAAPGPSSPVTVVQAFARRHPQQARELGLETTLRGWGTAVLQRDAARAEALLALAEALGTALRYQGGDASLIDAVNAILAVRHDPAATRTLARAHRAYAAGREAFDNAEFMAAADSFRIVRGLGSRSPALGAWAQAGYAATLVMNRREEAPRVLGSLVATIDSVRYPALAARVHWVIGHGLNPLDKAEARRHLARAARIYDSLGEHESFGGVWYREAWAQHRDGNPSAAYRTTGATLRALRPHRDSKHLHGALLQSSELVSRDGLRRAAMLIQAEDNKVAERVDGNPTILPEALMARGRTRALDDSTELARQDLAAADALVKTVPDSMQARRLQAIHQYSRALAAPAGTAAMAALDSAMVFFQDQNSDWRFASLVLRAERRLDVGSLDSADVDLDSLMAGLHATPPGTSSDFHLRATVLERMRSTSDRLVTQYVRAGRPLDALRVLERSRMSRTSDASRRAAWRTWTPPRAGQVVLEYALIGETLFTWVVRRDSVTLREQRLDRDALLRTIARVDVAMESGADAAATPDLRRLYEVLIRPVRNRIPAGEPELVIVADGEIAGIPFAALVDSASGERLIERYPVSHVLSRSELAPVATPANNGGRALLVADPAFDQLANLALDRLPGAKREVDLLLTLYPGAIRLAGGAATVAAFRDSVAGVRVIHYAGHAVFEHSRPEQSFLLLADDGTSGRLTADLVDELPLEGVQLVVLSACRTVRGWQGRSGGFAGLSGALLNAGANGVVGSLWLVNDSLAQPLMLDFHREYSKNPNPARALRGAQLAAIESGAPLAVWAGFRYMGR